VSRISDIPGSYVSSPTGGSPTLKLECRLDEEICQILRKRFHCLCEIKPPYCSCVTDLANVVLEKCEAEHEGEN
jgi:hypothetical protein